MTEAPLRVVIAEDNYLVREGTRRLLEASGEADVVAAVGDARELLDAVSRLKPDAVLTDIRMPPGHHMEGIDAAHAVRERSPEVGVVVLSQYADASYALALFRHGAAGLAYLLKDRVGDYEELVHALREVIAGRSVVDPDVVDRLVTGRARAAASPIKRLTPRELDVLRTMAAGRTNSAIGRELYLSESAVEKYINAIFMKLDLPPEASVHRRVAAVVRYLQDAAIVDGAPPE
ncbi:MAG: response regulator transcription factor [Acidimicrobiales bacterium]